MTSWYFSVQCTISCSVVQLFFAVNRYLFHTNLHFYNLLWVWGYANLVFIFTLQLSFNLGVSSACSARLILARIPEVCALLCTFLAPFLVTRHTFLRLTQLFLLFSSFLSLLFLGMLHFLCLNLSCDPAHILGKSACFLHAVWPGCARIFPS